MIDNKTCSRCTVNKPVGDFCKCSGKKDGYQSACKMCMNISYTISRKKKQQHYQQVARTRQNVYADRFREWKAQQKCIVCNEDEVSCLDLHHLDPSSKESTVSDAVYKWSWKRIQQEISKCVVICSNCHRKHHAGKLELPGVAQPD